MAGLRGWALALALSATTGCAPLYQNHGYIPDEDILSEIVVGVDTRETVEDVAGPPSASGVLREDGFYYVRSRMRTIGPLRPREIERQVLAISFSDDGVVENIESFGLEEGRVVALSRRVTDNGVTNLGFLRQLLGNVGRVNPADVFGGGG